MLLSDIDFDKLEKCEWKLAWGEGDPTLERFFFRHGGMIYKLWGKRYNVKDYIAVNGEYVRHSYRDAASGIAAIDLGFVDSQTCPALIDLIWDTEEVCRGYVMTEGMSLSSVSEITEDFFDLICSRSLSTGFLSTDFAPKNIIRVEQGLSLIDLDTVVTRLDSLDLEFETSKGSLRAHVVPEYKRFIHDTRFRQLYHLLSK